MRFSREQMFFYSRLAILAASAGWIASFLAGWKGVPFWHGAFALCFWIALALLNFPHKTSLWMLAHRRAPFLIFYGALAGAFMLLDQLALRLHLWFYPFYHGFWFIFIYGVLYPAAALAQLEFFYFIARLLKEVPTFRQPRETVAHKLIEGGESVLFLLMMLLVVFGAAGYSLSLPALSIAFLAWMAAATIKLGLRIAYPAHLAFLIVTVITAAFINWLLPDMTAFKWLYLEASVLNAEPLSVPVWVWLGSLWYTLFALRLWSFLALHPRVK